MIPDIRLAQTIKKNAFFDGENFLDHRLPPSVENILPTSMDVSEFVCVGTDNYTYEFSDTNGNRISFVPIDRLARGEVDPEKLSYSVDTNGRSRANINIPWSYLKEGNSIGLISDKHTRHGRYANHDLFPHVLEVCPIILNLGDDDDIWSDRRIISSKAYRDKNERLLQYVQKGNLYFETRGNHNGMEDWKEMLDQMNINGDSELQGYIQKVLNFLDLCEMQQGQRMVIPKYVHTFTSEIMANIGGYKLFGEHGDDETGSFRQNVVRETELVEEEDWVLRRSLLEVAGRFIAKQKNNFVTSEFASRGGTFAGELFQHNSLFKFMFRKALTTLDQQTDKLEQKFGRYVNNGGENDTLIASAHVHIPYLSGKRGMINTGNQLAEAIHSRIALQALARQRFNSFTVFNKDGIFQVNVPVRVL